MRHSTRGSRKDREKEQDEIAQHELMRKIMSEDFAYEPQKPPPEMTILQDIDTPINNFITTVEGETYYYNGLYWMRVDQRALSVLDNKEFGEITMQLGVNVRWNNIGAHQIPFLTGVYDVAADGHLELEPEYYLNTLVPWPYDSRKPCDTWEACLTTWFGSDVLGWQKIHALQEFFGYTLLMHSQYKTALLMIGPPNSGKSTINRVLTQMVGPFNTCSLPLNRLEDPRVLGATQGKLLVVADELDHSSHISEIGFRRLVSNGQPITVQTSRYQPPRVIIPTAKLAMFSHFVPSMGNWSEATLNRFLLIELTQTLPEVEQDRDLIEKLFYEIEGIVAWATEGARRLIENQGRFTHPTGSVERLRGYRQDQNPILAFITTHCEPDANSAIPTRDLTEQINQWEPDLKMTQTKLSRTLVQLGHTVGLNRIHKTSERCRCLSGYRFKSLENPPNGAQNEKS